MQDLRAANADANAKIDALKDDLKHKTEQVSSRDSMVADANRSSLEESGLVQL